MRTGECVPDCGGGKIEQHYIITQEAAGGGNDCPDFVRQNTTEVIECCGKIIASYMKMFCMGSENTL